MCQRCKNVFLLEVVETDAIEQAIKLFKSKYERYYSLPVKLDQIHLEPNGYESFEDHIESIEQDTFEGITYKKLPLNNVYIYTSELLKYNNRMVVTCVADRKPLYCLKW